MKKFALAALAAATITSGANAASFNFSFNDDYYGRGVVTGVIHGLSEGNNNFSALSATVTNGLGIVPDGYVFLSGSGYWGSITVTAGQVTFANAYLIQNTSFLFFATRPGARYLPELFNSLGGADAIAFSSTVFSPVATAAVPEPASWAMMLIGFGLVGGTIRYRRPRIAVAHA